MKGNWAASCQNQQNDCASSEDSDQPGLPQVLSKSSLCAQCVAKGQSFLHADSEDSDQSGRMPRLIGVFAGRTVTLLVCHEAAQFIKYRFMATGNAKQYWFSQKLNFDVVVWSNFCWDWARSFDPPHEKNNKMTVRPAKTQRLRSAWASALSD